MIGDVRLYRIAFGFPNRGQGDFRYVKELGGGALLDCGGYTIKLASMLLGNTSKIVTSKLNYVPEYEVDLYGSATIENQEGVVAQVSFGMDNSYKCELEVWGSKGSIYTNRILTAPVGFKPEVIVKTQEGEKCLNLPDDDSFLKSINYFADCIHNKEIRKQNYESIRVQGCLMAEILKTI